MGLLWTFPLSEVPRMGVINLDTLLSYAQGAPPVFTHDCNSFKHEFL